MKVCQALREAVLIGGVAVTITTSDREMNKAITWIGKHPDDMKAYTAVVDGMYRHVKDGEDEYHRYNKEFRVWINRMILQMSHLIQVP